MTTKIVVIGGCGHVGLPLAMAFADRGCSVVSYDINPEAVKLVNSGKMPFLEPDADEVMARLPGHRAPRPGDRVGVRLIEAPLLFPDR